MTQATTYPDALAIVRELNARANDWTLRLQPNEEGLPFAWAVVDTETLDIVGAGDTPLEAASDARETVRGWR